jgi:hypothetical protein
METYVLDPVLSVDMQKTPNPANDGKGNPVFSPKVNRRPLGTKEPLKHLQFRYQLLNR